MKSNLKKVLLSIGLILLVLLMCSCDLLFSTQVRFTNYSGYTLNFGYRTAYSTGDFSYLGTVSNGSSKSFDIESGTYDFLAEDSSTGGYYYEEVLQDRYIGFGDTYQVTAY